jgi:hypothetical protein
MCCGGVSGCELQGERLSEWCFGRLSVVVGERREVCKRRQNKLTE